MNTCKVCNNTGKKPGSDYLDCSAPGCNAIAERIDLNKFLASQRGLVSDELQDLAWSIHQRAAIAVIDRPTMGQSFKAAPSQPSLTVDTPEFDKVLTHYYNTASSFMGSTPSAHNRSAVVAHINTWQRAVTAKAVVEAERAKEHAIQQAQQHAMEARTQRDMVLDILRHFGCAEEDWHALELIKAVPRYIRPGELLIEGRTHDGNTIDLPIFGDGTKDGKRLFIVALPVSQASAPVAAVDLSPLYRYDLSGDGRQCRAAGLQKAASIVQDMQAENEDGDAALNRANAAILRALNKTEGA